MGYAGNKVPEYVIPTAISGRSGETLIGEEALPYDPRYPIRHGQVENWSDMESFWLESIGPKYLRIYPELHNLLLTEPPGNAPENREMAAEVWFEVFRVGGMYIGVQAVLALVASWASTAHKLKGDPLTGVVVDSGDGVTHIIPVVKFDFL